MTLYLYPLHTVQLCSSLLLVQLINTLSHSAFLSGDNFSLTSILFVVVIVIAVVVVVVLILLYHQVKSQLTNITILLLLSRFHAFF